MRHFMIRDRQTLILSDDLIAGMLSLQQTILLVEAAFAASAVGGALALPVVIASLDEFHIHFGIKSGCIKRPQPTSPQQSFTKYLSDNVGDVLGLKAGGYWFGNSAKGLPGHRAVLLSLDPETGNVVAVMSANCITRLRTAAAGAIAAKYLAREKAEVVAVIGAGEQAHAQLESLLTCRPIRQVYVWSRRPAAAQAYALKWKDSGLQVEAVEDMRKATAEADVVITATASTDALLNKESVRAGTHITAVGADGEGKQELDVGLLQRSKIVVDSIKQSLEIGELQHAVRAGLNARQMIHAELGEICVGMKPGRDNDTEITVFDSSGVSFQDLVVAGYLVRRAQSERVGEYVRL